MSYKILTFNNILELTKFHQMDDKYIMNMFPFNFREKKLVCESYISVLQKQKTMALDWVAPLNMFGA
jgi:hypothetical protein